MTDPGNEGTTTKSQATKHQLVKIHLMQKSGRKTLCKRNLDYPVGGRSYRCGSQIIIASNAENEVTCVKCLKELNSPQEPKTGGATSCKKFAAPQKTKTPIAYLINEHRKEWENPRIMCGKMYLSESVAEEAAVRLSNRWRWCTVLPVIPL